jgi:hypothetical protein
MEAETRRKKNKRGVRSRENKSEHAMERRSQSGSTRVVKAILKVWSQT